MEGWAVCLVAKEVLRAAPEPRLHHQAEASDEDHAAGWRGKNITFH